MLTCLAALWLRKQDPKREVMIPQRLPRRCSGKGSTSPCRRGKRRGFDPWVGKIPWNRKWQPTPVFLPGKVHGPRSLVGYGPWGHKSRTRQAHTHTVSPRHTARTGRSACLRFSPASLLLFSVPRLCESKYVCVE